MSYRIAAIDVHKKMLAVVVADVGGEGEYQFERRKFGASPGGIARAGPMAGPAGGRGSGDGIDRAVLEASVGSAGAVLEASAPEQREGATKMSGTLHLCQAKSNRGPRGRKNDFADGERMIKRLVAQELVLSFVPDPEQRLWRTVTRRKHQLTRAKVRFQEPTGEPVGTGAHQVVEFGVGSAGRQRAAHVEGIGRRGNRPGRSGGAGGSPAAGHAGTIA